MSARSLIEIFRYHSPVETAAPERPWQLGPWLWATQGHFLVARLDDGSPSDPTPEPKLKARRYLEDTPADLVPVSLRALREFAGAVEQADQPCEGCHGSGYDDFGRELVKCEHCAQLTRQECPQCGGDRLAGLSWRPGRVAGIPVNLALLAYALSFGSDDGTVHVGSLASCSTGTPGRALLVDGANWRAVVMSIHEQAEAMPAFVVEPRASVK